MPYKMSWIADPAKNFPFKMNNGNTGKTSEICSKLILLRNRKVAWENEDRNISILEIGGIGRRQKLQDPLEILIPQKCLAFILLYQI